jgi:hypothetical protein
MIYLLYPSSIVIARGCLYVDLFVLIIYCIITMGVHTVRVILQYHEFGSSKTRGAAKFWFPLKHGGDDACDINNILGCSITVHSFMLRG